jgi:hypothetical protein
MTDEEIAYLNNYGTCTLGEGCLCIRGAHPEFGPKWSGLACQNWQSLGARSHEDLIRIAKERYRRSVEQCGND